MLERSYFSKEFKRAVVEELLTGKLSKEELRRKYGIRGHSAILNWVSDYKKEQILQQQNNNNPLEELNHTEMLIRLKELEKALSESQFKNDAYLTYIKALETAQEVGQLKKSVTKQSKD